MLTFPEKEKYTIEDLRHLVTLLRSPEGCPWDREQTHESIRRNLIEEAYEAAEAIDENDREHLIEELGDVLLQVLFHADIEAEQGNFDLEDVTDGTCRKLLRRHPHVFAPEPNPGVEATLATWEAVKRTERKDSTVTGSLEAVSKTLPALWRADKLQSKAGKAGFALGSAEDIAAAFRSAADALENGGTDKALVGPLLFSLVRLAQISEIDPEDALNAENSAFIQRFKTYESERNK